MQTVDGKRVRLDKWRPCKHQAMVGLDVCHMHGGKAKRPKAVSDWAKTERRAEHMAHKWGVAIKTTPVEAILNQVNVWAGLEAYYRQRVEALTDEDLVWGRTKETEGDVVVGNGPSASLDKATTTTDEAKPNILIILHEQASVNLVRFSTEAIKAGIEERRVRLAEQQGALVADAIRRILDQLGLTPEQAALVPRIVPAELRLIAGGAA
jgi:hypothetical protein